MRQSRQNNDDRGNIEFFLCTKLLDQYLTKGYFRAGCLRSTTCSQNNKKSNSNDLDEKGQKIMNGSRYAIISRNLLTCLNV